MSKEEKKKKMNSEDINTAVNISIIHIHFKALQHNKAVSILHLKSEAVLRSVLCRQNGSLDGVGHCGDHLSSVLSGIAWNHGVEDIFPIASEEREGISEGSSNSWIDGCFFKPITLASLLSAYRWQSNFKNYFGCL